MNIEEANRLLNQALEELRRGEPAKAERLLQRADEFPETLRDRDLLGAMIRCAKGDLPGGISRLEAEIRSFPDNTAAVDLLKALQTEVCAGGEEQSLNSAVLKVRQPLRIPPRREPWK